MSIVLEKNSKVDTRQFEYEQDILRLGKDRAGLAAKKEQEEKDLKVVEDAKAQKKSELDVLEENLTKLKEAGAVILDQYIQSQRDTVDRLNADIDRIEKEKSRVESGLADLNNSVESKKQEIEQEQRKLDERVAFLDRKERDLGVIERRVVGKYKELYPDREVEFI